MNKKKGKQKVPPISEDCEQPGIEYVIPATKKVFSLGLSMLIIVLAPFCNIYSQLTAGLPFGPQRKQLEELLVALSADKQSIRLTIQQNKNFYAVAKSGEVDKVLSILGIPLYSCSSLNPFH